MSRVNRGLGSVLILLVVGLLCLGATQAMAQTTEPPETGVTDPPPVGETEGDEGETPDPANPPKFIREMVQAQLVTQEQINAMLAGGYGWGEVRLATRLAQQMVANNAEGLLFEDALAQVMAARTEGKGFGQIAAENNLKIGQLVGQRKAGDTQNPSAVQTRNRTRTQEMNGDEPITPDPANPPKFIREMVQAQLVTQEQVNTMLAGGYGWGEVRLATRLAQQMVANSAEGLLFEDALAQVMAARTEGKGFGQIAAENNLRIGQLVGRGKAGDAQNRSAVQTRNRIRAEEMNGDEPITPDPANPPKFIREMLQAQVVTQEQVNTMLADGFGWGEVRIASLMAQQMVANSNETLTFDAALAQIMAARAEGKDFGQIAADNNLKVGDLVGKKGVGKPQNGSAAKADGKAAASEKKPGFFARLGRFLVYGRSADKPGQAVGVQRNLQEGSPQALRGDKPGRPVRTERAVQAERPEKLEKPEKPNKPQHMGPRQ